MLDPVREDGFIFLFFIRGYFSTVDLIVNIGVVAASVSMFALGNSSMPENLSSLE